MWNIVQVIHKDIIEVKRIEMNAVTYEYKLFRMKLEKNS